MNAKDLESLFPYANPHQKKILRAIIDAGSASAAARRLGKNASSVCNLVRRVKKRAAARGWSPEHDMTHATPETHFVKGTSTLYDADGTVALQWVKTQADLDRINEALAAFADELAEGVRGKWRPVKRRPKSVETEIATHYKIGDQHLGLYAWGEETGDEDYDLERSTRDVVGGIGYLVDAARPTEIGVLVNVGDFLHANDRKSQTPGSGNALDTDTRHGKVARRAAHVLRDATRLMLRKHERVVVINARGNHDPDAAVGLQITLEAYFESDERVDVLRNDQKVLPWVFGQTCVLIYHGEKDRRRQMEYLAKRFRKEIGSCRKVYVDNGHIHHKQREEIGPLQFEVWHPLAASDQYHADSLYGADRSITSVVYHKKYGEVGRTVCDLQMIRDLESDE